jgi:high affinity Mn2+ porin
MSRIPNAKVTGVDFGQFMAVAEVEKRYELGIGPGKARLLVFRNRARMANYADALALAAATDSVPDLEPVRRRQWRGGVAINVEQQVAQGVGVFLRASRNDGRREAFEFTEINRSVAAGASVKGERWARAEDEIGVAAARNALSSDARAYFAAGGNGILIGDGALRYGAEQIAEAYYSIALRKQMAITLDVQRIVHPAYNRDRGPVTVWGVRTHAEF